jgi:hypothetical protein
VGPPRTHVPSTPPPCQAGNIPFRTIDIAVPEVLIGGLLGVMMVFYFTGLAVAAVGTTAGACGAAGLTGAAHARPWGRLCGAVWGSAGVPVCETAAVCETCVCLCGRG